MNQRKILVIIAAFLFAIAMLWLMVSSPSPETDNPRYERWKRTVRLEARTTWWERNLPSSISQMLRLPTREQRYRDEHEQLGEMLVDVGYLTNVTVTLPNPPTNGPQYVQLAMRVRKAFPDHEGWELRFHSNTVVVTCRPEKAALFQQALHQ